jgi:flagellar hook-associated protein 2
MKHAVLSPSRLRSELKSGQENDDIPTMGTVGISFGSPTSGQGFDVQSTVAAIVANLQAVETPWKNQLTSLGNQDTALTSIGSDLSALSTALAALTGSQGVLSEKEGSSSDESVLTLTGATSSAVAGNYAVVVNNLAQTSTYNSTAITSGDTLSGSITLDNQTITLDSSDDTLAGLASTINSGKYGVTANVISTSSGDVLSLVSNTSGAAGDINISGSLTDTATSGSSAGATVSFSQEQAGKDASLTVNGLNITSASNTVTNGIPGVTMQLLNSSATGSSVNVEITNDNSDVESAVGNFVNAYNTVMGDLNTQEGDDSSGNPEPLFGNPTIATLQEQLQQALNFTPSGSGITSLSQLGISVNSDGTLTLDGDTLSTELNSNFQDVANFFQPGNGTTSFGDNLTTILNSLGNSGPSDGSTVSGAIFLQLQQDKSVESTLNTNVTNENTLISTEQTQLTTELNQANFILQEIPQQLQSVNEMYSAITGFNENPQG